MLLRNWNRQLVLTFLILCFVKYEWNHLPASPHNYDHDGLLRMLQVRAATSPHINVAHDHQHFKVGEPEPPQGSADYDSHPLKVGAQERQTTSPRRSTTSHKSKKRTISRKSKRKIIYGALGISALVLVLLLLSISTCLICRRKRGRGNDVELQAIEEQLKKCEKFNFRTIVEATQDFSSGNKLGEGGYGPVYKIWELWRVGRPLELVDEAVAASCDSNQNLVRFINIGLLCVQKSAEDRPSMSDVVHMLESTANIQLPEPKEPPCYGDRPNLEA